MHEPQQKCTRYRASFPQKLLAVITICKKVAKVLFVSNQVNFFNEAKRKEDFVLHVGVADYFTKK